MRHSRFDLGSASATGYVELMGSATLTFQDPIAPLLSPDDAQPIGSVSPFIPATACRVTLMADGDAAFGEEEPIEIHPHVYRMVTLSDGGRHALVRCEIKACFARGRTTPSAADSVLVTEFPYANAWFVEARFKAGSHKSGDARQSVAAETLDGARRELEKRTLDAWETGDRLVAALEPPPSLSVLHDDLRNQTAATWVVGVCENLPTARERLAKSQQAQQLLTLARSGRLRVGPNEIPVHPRVAEDANAILFVALNQAFAGPRSPGQQSTVLQLAKNIFFDHLYNGTRRELRIDRRLQEGKD